MSDEKTAKLRRAWKADGTLEAGLAYYRELAKSCSDNCPACGHDESSGEPNVTMTTDASTYMAARCMRCGVMRGQDARAEVHQFERWIEEEKTL